MKTIIFTLIPLLFSFTTINDNAVDRIGVEGPLKFNETEFKLKWSDKPNDIYYIQEYLPEGEKLESFNQMLTIHLFQTELETKDAASQKVAELLERKKTDPICRYQVSESPDRKEFIVDFLVGESKDDKMTIVEFNVYRFKQIQINKKKKALLVYTYSKRGYGEDITTFFKTLKDDRKNYVSQMISADLPNVTIK